MLNKEILNLTTIKVKNHLLFVYKWLNSIFSLIELGPILALLDKYEITNASNSD